VDDALGFFDLAFGDIDAESLQLSGGRKSGVNLAGRLKRADHQAGTDEQDYGECGLHDDQRVAGAVPLLAVAERASAEAAGAVTRIMSPLLFETSPVDPLTYAVASVGLLGAAAIASYLPAHRASSVNPVEALRME